MSGFIKNVFCVNLSLDQLESESELRAKNNIVVSGGGSLFPGFSDRLQVELSQLLPDWQRERLLVPSDRHISAWIGGSLLSSHPTFPRIDLSKANFFPYRFVAVHLYFHACI